MTDSILYLNVVLHLNHEKCVSNELHTAPIKHIGGIWRERINRGLEVYVCVCGEGLQKRSEKAMKDERKEQKKLDRKKKRADMKEGAEGGDTNKAPTDEN